MKTKLSLFEENEVRKAYKNNKWYYSIIDVINILTDSKNPNQYLKSLKSKDIELQNNWSNICTYLNMPTPDGKIRKIQTADTIGILRIIQSIQSSKSEQFKIWLSKLGNERLEEINNPELVMDRMKKIYEMKGYSPFWIEQREREITIRHSLQEEWEKRGIKKEVEYLILMDDIYLSSFGVDLNQFKEIKGIKENSFLKDSMTNLELALTSLEEIMALELHKKNDSRGITEIKRDINQTSKIINTTKREIEEKLCRNVISPENYMNLTTKND